MGIIINKCIKCGHEWPQSTPQPPRRCPAEGCRTVRWKAPDTGYYEAILDSCKEPGLGKKARKELEQQAKRMLERYK